jgi:putative ABC transport system permease protein
MNDAKLIFADQVDENYLNAMEIPLLAGRGFTKADTLNQIIINETAAKEIGFDINEVPGKNLYSGPLNAMDTFPVIGVMKDFNFSTLHEKINPLFFRYNRRNPNILVSFQAGNYSTTLANLETIWKQVNPNEPFVYFFLDESIQKQYQTENTMLRIINSFTLLAVLICCMGLFGLVAFTAERRAKEIGVRKVLGASISNITLLLSKDFLKLVLISIAIVSPIAYFFMHKWLQDFAYRINIDVWTFILAASIAIIFALLTVGFQSIKAAITNPVKSLRTE